jgi:acyl-CoA thioesterase
MTSVPTEPRPRDPAAVATAMHRLDRVAHAHDMSIDHVDVGRATVSVTITPEMANGLGVCHGGLVFTLADTAMAYASNAADERTFSTTATIDWVRPAQVGSRLSATSTRAATRGRNTIHDIVVTDERGEVVALVRGQTLTVGGRVAAPADGAAAAMLATDEGGSEEDRR